MSFANMFRRCLRLVVLGVAVAWSRAQEAPAEFFVNKGNVTNVQVNARNFVNDGRFTVLSSVPWDPQNTVNFTNRGTINGSVGFRFETVSSGFGIRQQTDIACKALSAAINDPYTAVQAIEHLAVVYCDLAVRPLGAKVLDGPGGRGRVVVPGSTFSEYVRFISDVLGRYGANDVSVMLAFVRLLRVCAEVLPAGSERLDVLDQAAATALADVERAMPRTSDIDRVRAAVTSLHHAISERREWEVARA